MPKQTKQLKKPGQTKLEFEHISHNGKSTFKLVSFTNVIKFDDLPKSYVMSFPHYYLDNGCQIVIVIERGKSLTLHENLVINKADLNYVIKLMKRCGHKLTAVNRLYKKLQEISRSNIIIEI